MIVLLDNYDSFSYNLYQAVGAVTPQIQVIRSDAITLEELKAMAPAAILLSPGPGYPKDAGICMDVVKQLGSQIPILGICLGHQAICQAFGATISHAKRLMHGKQSFIYPSRPSPLFQGIPTPFRAARYHSLAARPDTIPPELIVTASTKDGEIMAVEHRKFPIYGVQFHPESILTPDGAKIIKNFLEVACHD